VVKLTASERSWALPPLPHDPAPHTALPPLFITPTPDAALASDLTTAAPNTKAHHHRNRNPQTSPARHRYRGEAEAGRHTPPSSLCSPHRPPQAKKEAKAATPSPMPQGAAAAA